MTEWQPILFGCPPEFFDYGWLACNPVDYPFMPILEPYCRDDSPFLERRAKWILGEQNGRVFFGRFGDVGEILEKHQAATDKSGRKLEFFLGYSAPTKGTTLPRREDFDTIDEKIIKPGLEEFYRELSGTLRRISPAPGTFKFSGTRDRPVSDNDWNRTATAIEKRKEKSTLAIITQQGDIRTENLKKKLLGTRMGEPGRKANLRMARIATILIIVGVIALLLLIVTKLL